MSHGNDGGFWVVLLSYCNPQGPIVQSYDLDMNEGLLHLTFNLEVFGGSLIHADSIALQRVQNDSDLTSSLHLTPTSV